MMKAPPVELRSRVPGTFDIFVIGQWIGTVQYLWEHWYYSYLGKSLGLVGYSSPQEAVAAILKFHVARCTRGEHDVHVPCPRDQPDQELPP